MGSTPDNKSGSKHVHMQEKNSSTRKLWFQNRSQQKKLNAHIVKGGRPNLLGRDWLEIRLDWETIFQIASDNPQSVLQEVLSKYQDVFAEGLGTLKGVKAKI